MARTPEVNWDADPDIVEAKLNRIASKISKKVRRERLKRLYEVVCKVPDSSFDQGTWGYKDKEGHTCQTVGCTLGWAAISGAFKSEGLKAVWNRAFSHDSELAFKYKGRNAMPEEVAAGLFGLSCDEECHIFGGGDDYNEGRRGKAESMARIAWLARGKSMDDYYKLPDDRRDALVDRQYAKLEKIYGPEE